jgi:thiopurine S-methyltransferase
MPHQDHEDWLQRWQEGRINWHKTVVDPVLEKHIGLLEDSGGSGRSILVTMCGKSVDLLWLCSRGHSVTGVELSPIAVDQLFQENSVPYTVTECGEFSIYSATDRSLKVYCGDILKFGPSDAGQFDVIWDCNAIVALSVEDRDKYVQLLVSVLKPGGRILMTTWVYEQSIHISRPYSMPPDMIRGLFDSLCDTQEVENIDMPTTSKLCQQFNLSWAVRPVLLLTMK